MTCINCQQEVTGKFCPNCGQRTNVKRITFREGWNDFWSRVYGFDGMFPRTIRDLTVRPGKVAQHYISGNRVLYYGPVGYFFLMLTLYVLIISLLEIDMAEMAKAINPYAEIKEGSGQEQFNKGLMGWIKDNQRMVSFIFVPFYVFGASLFFRKNKYNLLEHSILVFYTQGHYMWLSIAYLAIFKLTGKHLNVFLFATTSALYYAWACSQLYQSYKAGWAFVRGIFVHLFFWFSIFLVTAVLMIIAFILNPELMEMIRPRNN
ncbi:MAG TPA: DUF3667 domain-containing protein [Cyclobacteriaceae bacterium]|mgnify:CR=1 FL=1|nr:DUF3667 domain-containing protein [Cyclobacteriaceae bacterium]HRJ83991.1 DUF3667 domain-containing protein [Cyclobacteriaceae bacterium]